MTTLPRDGAHFVSSSEKILSKSCSSVKLTIDLDNTLEYCTAGKVSAEKEVVLALFSMKALMVREEKTHQAR